MPLSKETKDRISKESIGFYLSAESMDSGVFMEGYIAGAEAEAERAAGLVRELNEVLEAMEGKYWHVAKSLLKQTLTKYNNSK